MQDSTPYLLVAAGLDSQPRLAKEELLVTEKHGVCFDAYSLHDLNLALTLRSHHLRGRHQFDEDF